MSARFSVTVLLEIDSVLNDELAGSRNDLRRGLVSPEEDHDDPCADGRRPCADEWEVRIIRAAVTSSPDPQNGSSGFVRDAPAMVITPPTTVRTIPPTHTLCRDFPGAEAACFADMPRRASPNGPAWPIAGNRTHRAQASRHRSVDLIWWLIGKWKQGLSQGIEHRAGGVGPARLHHDDAPLLAHVEHLVSRATDLRTREGPIHFEHDLPAKLVGLERANGAQFAITLVFAQLEASSERYGMAVPDGALEGCGHGPAR